MSRAARAAAAFFSAYGMLAVLLLLCLSFARATYTTEYPSGSAGAEALAKELKAAAGRPGSVVVVAPADDAGREFARVLKQRLAASGIPVAGVFLGDPPAVREGLERLAGAPSDGAPAAGGSRSRGGRADVVATTRECADWALFAALRRDHPALGALAIRTPPGYGRSTFLAPGNLRNVADQIAVIAIIAVGMTLVIITGGIDLSVGSLVALGAVLTAELIRRWGGPGASGGTMAIASLAAIGACGLVGAFSGLVITRFRVPPFIATLAMMQVASGWAFMVARGQSIYDLPPAFTWLGRGAGMLALPNAVWLMLILYLLAHVLMSRTPLGRRLYAVGSNPRAARLSGVRNDRVLLFAYVVSGLMAGIGGVLTVSQLNAGAPTYGLMYELYVIAAVVVGGTSLAGGEGRVFGTLIGAFIIAVIRNGMNLTNVEPYTQKVILGLVILGAVLLDRLKHRAWQRSAVE